MKRKRGRTNGKNGEKTTSAEIYEMFVQAQLLESDDLIEEAVETYEEIIQRVEKNAEGNTIVPITLDAILKNAKRMKEIPEELLASCALNCIGGHYLDIDLLKEGREYFEKALSFWIDNSMAMLNVANLEREHGDILRAIDTYSKINDLSIYLTNECGTIDWISDMVISPLKQSIEISMYMSAFLLHLQGRFSEARDLLKNFKCRYRIAPAVWSCIGNNEFNATLSCGRRSHGLSQTKSSSVQLIGEPIPSEYIKALQKTFSPKSDFWSVTSYRDRGYFSFWYDIDKKPDNLVETVITEFLLPVVKQTRSLKKPIVGAEWWVHTRKCGRNLGHQLHFDTEENSLQIKRKILHPVVSSVLYLSIGNDGNLGGPTILLNQRVDGKMAEKAWVVNPVKGGFLTFPGDLLHGVLPGKPWTESGEESSDHHRLTLMVGFWDSPVGKLGKRVTLGPCAPIPKQTRSCTWPALLQNHVKPTPKLRPNPFELSDCVQTVSPAWEKFLDDDDVENESQVDDRRKYQIPADVDLGFFVNEMEEFRAHLVERILER